MEMLLLLLTTTGNLYLTGCRDICLNYTTFIDAVKFRLHQTVSGKIFRLKSKDPYFIAPPIRLFLVKRCRLRERALVMEIKGDDLGQGRQSTGPVHVCLRGAISREFESAPSLEELEEENR